ncbi:hypothetical protein A7A78_00210 [Aequorivita soesokkakensis]|uniref:Uncharacterized protein n=1 Tax=Aequorivita soesokkakensis TaxID=1385699 RepID=A0A1A9LGY6_9FLAO|nr:hypothetical protein [Aequorivita soesokkakensis]OAD92377.1 hypothetical protein A7A78_00210 [Aequorivita soesokkakensis]
MIEFPTIKYQLKDSDANPFDIDAKENIFFFDGNYSSLSNNTEELDSCYEQSTANSVLVMHRLDFISKGVILKHFQKDETLYQRTTSDGKLFYSILSSQLIDLLFEMKSESIIIKTYNVSNPNNPLARFIWHDYEECLAFAKQYSSKSADAFLVVQCLWIADTH